MKFFKDTYGLRKRDNRPHGTLPVSSLQKEMLENALDYVNQLANFPEVIGITLTGGLSRGYADRLSEIDLNIYLTKESYRIWKMGKGPIPHGDHKGSKHHMDVSFLDFEREKKGKWNLLKKWDSSYAKILYDPDKMIEKLLDSKDVFTAEEKYGIALNNYLDCVYFADIAVRQWSLREDPLVANQLINKAIPSLCNLLFLANDEYPAFEKWLVNYSYSLQWKTSDWEKWLKEITTIREITIEEAFRRRDKILKLYHEIWAKIVGEEYQDTGLLELAALDALEYVIKNTPTVKKFQEKYGIDQLGYELLYKLADIEQRGDDEIIIFNREKFLIEKEKGFPSFLDWNKDVLAHIRLSQS
jgi:hypothetical protein